MCTGTKADFSQCEEKNFKKIFFFIQKMLVQINVLYCFLLIYSTFQLEISINVEMQRAKKSADKVGIG